MQYMPIKIKCFFCRLANTGRLMDDDDEDLFLDDDWTLNYDRRPGKYILRKTTMLKYINIHCLTCTSLDKPV